MMPATSDRHVGVVLGGREQYRARLSAIDKDVHLAQVQARIEREALTAEMARTLADLRRTIGWSAARAASQLTASVEYYMTLEDGTTGEPSQMIEAYDLLHACWAGGLEARMRQDPPYDARRTAAREVPLAVPRDVPGGLPGQTPRAETRAGDQDTA